MPRLSAPLRAAVFLILALAAAVFFAVRAQAGAFTFSGHAFSPAAPALTASCAALLVLVAGLWALASLVLSRASGLPFKEAAARDFWTWAPLLGLGLAPLIPARYFTRSDLIERLGLWLAAVLAAVLYLKAAVWFRTGTERTWPWTPLWRRFLDLPPRRKLPWLFAASLLVLNAGSLWLMHSIDVSGDEPHYLIISHSLLKDGDFDLADNYDRRDYARYMEPGGGLTPHTLPGLKPGTRYSFHSPGLSFLLLPFYAAGSLFGKSVLLLFVRFGMSLFGALFGLQIYLYAVREWGRERLALLLWALAGTTAPFFFYGFHIYPEIVVALFSLTVFRLLRHARPMTAGRWLLCGGLLASFIWFHALKYAFILAPLGLYALVRLLKDKARFRSWAAFLAFPVVLTALYFVFQYALFGSLNPTSVSWQGAMDGRESLGFLKFLVSGIPMRYRVETLAGFFFDQRDGLLFYAPIYAFAFLGLVVALRRKAGRVGWLLAATAPYVLVTAFLTQRAGFAPQGRPIVAVGWALVIGLGHYLAESGKRAFAFLFKLAAAWSLLAAGLLLAHPLALFQETTQGTVERGGDLFYLLSNLHHSLPRLLPSFLKTENGNWPPNVFWPGLLLAFLILYLLARKRPVRWGFGSHLALAAAALAAFFLWFAAVPRNAPSGALKTELADGSRWTFLSLSKAAVMEKPGRFQLLQGGRGYDFLFASRRPVPALAVDYGPGAGDQRASLGFFDEPVAPLPGAGGGGTRIFPAPPFYRWKGGCLYLVTVRLETKAGIRAAPSPYLFSLRPAR